MIALWGFSVLVFFSSALWSNEREKIADYVVRRAYTSIAGIQEDKVFLKPESLRLKHGKIYIEDADGGEFAVPAVFSSEVLLPYVQVGQSTVFNVWICECGAWNHNWDNPTSCWSCGKPR